MTYFRIISLGLLFANAIILLCFYFLVLVTFSNDLLIPFNVVNIKIKEEPAIPVGVPTTEAYEAMLNIPNDVHKAINILSK